MTQHNEPWTTCNNKSCHQWEACMYATCISPRPQPTAEPVAWRTEYRDAYRGRVLDWHYRYHDTEPRPGPLTRDGCGHRNVVPLYTHPPATLPEPVAKCPTCGEKRLDCYGADEPTQCPKYTLPATLPEPVDDGLGPYDLKVLRRDDYSGEHREWYESITIPKGHEIVRKIVSEALPVIATQAAAIQSLRAEIARKDDALRAVEDATLHHGDGAIGECGWNITKLNKARPMIRAALNPKETNDG